MNQEEQYDAVVVGAGIAGAIIAKRLGEEGKRVLILESGPDFRQGPSRETYVEAFYKASAKVPEAPYPDDLYAPHAEVLQIGNYEPVGNGQHRKLKLKPGTTSYLDQKGPLPFSSTYERLAGGTMWHWLGTCLRMLPNDFKTKTLYGHGVDWPISYNDLEPYYCEAEYLIGVSANANEQSYHGVYFTPGYDYPMEAIPPSQTDQFVASNIQGLTLDGEALSVTPTPAGRNSRARNDYDNGRRACAGNTSCVPICPIQAKYDPTITLAQALQTGHVEMRTNCVAVDVKVDADTQKVIGVEYVHYQNDGSKQRHTVSGKLYALAAHAIETPRLLLNSNNGKGVANSSDQLGRNLMDHPVMNGWAMLPEKVYPFRGPVSTSGIENLRDGSFRSHRSAFRIEIHNVGWNWPENAPFQDLTDMVFSEGLFGDSLRKQLNNQVARQLDLNFLIDQQPQEHNRITLSKHKQDALGIPLPEIHYGFSDYDMNGFVAAFETADKIFSQLGARNHTHFDDTSKPNYFEYKGRGYEFQGAGHIVGTMRMGDNPKQSVVDKELRSWDHPNLFLLGSGVFPTIATSNPTLTIAALTLRAADTMIKELT